ncbi:two-component sensor histidine kinase [Actinoplanes philippinensis]|uniref:histidine kinase n=1 Tax=Actinoplanes philippinensis TaxID=35752 RepID=A0A1I2ISD9_9ACTN|nr:HAMP domain-containing sensor histidine kinase [Actinoplanes philippinensis]GIE78979.1 two-component sensor histidine kinase [Actinoplanes philippinensis]SFF45225.1 two-component system, OmpR family, sensor kinase [Actinoplanes philippinensis]
MPAAAPTRRTRPSRPSRPAWRDPAGWPLRTRIVATMIALLAVLGLVVGGTAELYLHKSLYHQLDEKLAETQKFGVRGGGGSWGKPPGDGPSTKSEGSPLDSPPPNVDRGSLLIFLDATDGSFKGGGKIVADEAESATGFFGNYYDRPGDEALSSLYATMIAAGEDHAIDVDVTVRDTTNEYYTVAERKRIGNNEYLVITALSLEDTNHTLRTVALFTGCVVVGSLLIAGWGGALIVRRTLKPLDRVAATATRVSELRLDRGEVRLAQRVPEADTDPRTEVGQVGAALNRMLDHVGNALEARHASEMQVRQFVADASHELRTPLAAIRGYAELSRRSRQVVPDEISHVLNRVESEAKRMTALVEDLLLLARLDAGRPLAQDPVDLTMLAVDATSDAHAAGPSHYWQLDLPDEPVTVIGDGARLHQVVANLLANARTHTPEGSTVTVKVGAVPNAAVIQVIDNGPGIQPDVVPRIFERFARGDSSRSRAAGSTGLGLSIVHAVVTSHRGKVGVQSRPGQTVFTVMLPLGPPPVVPTAEQRPQMLHPVG